MPKKLKFGFLKIGESGYVIAVKDYSILELIAEQEYIQKERDLMFQLLA
jgi:hypothetical protein